MLRKYALSLLACLTVLSFAALGYAGYPDPTMSTAVTAATGQVSVFSSPDGTGNPINACRYATGPADATITLTVLDIYGTPVVAYPREDMWLETEFGGVLPCTDGTIADADTDIAGQTTFSQAVYVGGFSDRPGGEGTVVVIDGMPLTQPALDILFNSGDLSKDRQVGVSDTALFVPLYTSGLYHYEIDYFFDLAITLSDLVLYAGTQNVTCPPTP